MNRYFKLVLTALILLVSTIAFAQIDINNNEIGKVAQELEKQRENKNDISSLYSLVRQDLVKYYGRKDFSDSDHKTGWYRVDDFLKWVRENEQVLDKDNVSVADKRYNLKEAYKNSKNSFWVYLGVKYIASKYGIYTNLDKISIFPEKANACTFGEGVICIPRDEQLPSVLINTGIHEATHFLPYLKNEDKKKLSELATFYSEYNYALPVKSKDAVSFSAGVRDFRRTAELRPDFDILFEYNYYLVGLLLNSQIHPSDIFSFIKTSGNDISINNSCFLLAALANNKLFNVVKNLTSVMLEVAYDSFNNEEISLLKKNPNKYVYLGEKELLDKKYKNFFGKFYTNDSMSYIECYEGTETINTKKYVENILGNNLKNTRNVKLFYDSLYKKLPREFTEKYFVQAESEQIQTYQNWGGYTLVEPYNDEIIKAILETLEEMKVPQAVIPEGYL